METTLQILSGLIQTMRPKQWTKNILFVFPAIIFDEKLFEPELLARVTAACLLLILMSGSMYIVNDLADLENDKLHPTKRYRPIASGVLPLSIARLAAILMPVFAVAAAFYLDVELTLILIAYWLIQILYSLRLKHLVLIDVFTVAAGFLLRVMAGGAVIDVIISPWLYAFVGLLALFLVIAKRRQEWVMLGDHALNTRPIFKQYNLPLLDNMLGIVATSTVITYILYTIEVETMTKYGANLGLLTVPMVVYGLFRYLYLIHVKEEGGAPDEVLLTDRPIQLTMIAAGLTFFVILYLL